MALEVVQQAATRMEAKMPHSSSEQVVAWLYHLSSLHRDHCQSGSAWKLLAWKPFLMEARKYLAVQV